MTALIPDALLLTTTAGFAVTGVAAVRYRHQARSAVAEARRQTAVRDEEARHLAGSRIPGLVYALRNGTGDLLSSAGRPLHRELAATETGTAFASVLEQVDAMLREANERAETASRAAVQAATRSVQALVYEQQAAITRLLAATQDEDTLERAQHIDHAASQLARRLQILGVLTGMWPGRQRDDAPLLTVIRGGAGRIKDFQRVRLPRTCPWYVAGRYVEPVVLAVAELLDNAARHSAPTTPVEITFVGGHNGVGGVIHDAGPGMAAEVREQAGRRLSGRYPVRLTELANPPSFGHLGIGALAARYGFTVQLDQDHSRHGGVRAVLFLPRALLAEPPAQQPAHRPTRQHDTRQPAAAGTAVGTAPRPDPGRYRMGDDGLPIRGPRRARGPVVPRLPESVPPPADSGRALAAFVHGTQAVFPPSAAPETPAPETPAPETPAREETQR
ncbi:ATP-binding protein [Streptomyces sp. NPDC059627]